MISGISRLIYFYIYISREETMKFCLAFFFALIGLVNSRPKNSDDTFLCSEFKGHRCVPEENCLSSDGFLEDEIFSDVLTGSYYWP